MLLVLVLAADSEVGAGSGVISVNTETDSLDVNPGNGTCADAVGECSLRAAVQESNSMPGQQTIVVAAGTYRLTIPGRLENESAAGDLDILDDTVISGAGPEQTTVSGEGLDRVLETHSPQSLPFTLGLNGLSLTHGHAMFEPFARSGDGGGMYNDGDFNVALDDVAVRGNRADFFGGGIYNEQPTRDAMMQGINVLITQNHAGQSGGGIYGGSVSLARSTVESNSSDLSGGGIDSGFRLELSDSVVRSNRAGNQGGITSGTTLLVRRSSIVENVASNTTGGIGGGGTWRIEDSTIAGNRAERGEAGGAFYTGGAEGETHVVIERTSFTGNTAGLEGGAFYVWTGARVAITNTTFSGNTSGTAVASTPSRGGGGGVFVLFGALDILNSTLAGNLAPTGSSMAVSPLNESRRVTIQNTIVVGGEVSCDGAVISEGNNVVDSQTCLPQADSDVLISDAETILGPLREDGGTLVHPLVTTGRTRNPAIDAAHQASCPTIDQRGKPRPSDGDGDGLAVCDVGAYELTISGRPTPTLRVSTNPQATPAAFPRTGGSR